MNFWNIQSFPKVIHLELVLSDVATGFVNFQVFCRGETVLRLAVEEGFSLTLRLVTPIGQLPEEELSSFLVIGLYAGLVALLLSRAVLLLLKMSPNLARLGHKLGVFVKGLLLGQGMLDFQGFLTLLLGRSD